MVLVPDKVAVFGPDNCVHTVEATLPSGSEDVPDIVTELLGHVTSMTDGEIPAEGSWLMAIVTGVEVGPAAHPEFEIETV